MWRLACPGGGAGGGGLAGSEEGGWEGVEESLREAASWSWSWRTAARNSSIARRWTSSCACNRSQFGHRLAGVFPMFFVLRRHAPGGIHLMNEYQERKERAMLDRNGMNWLVLLAIAVIV